MNFFALVRSLAASLFHRSGAETEIDEELRSHILERTDDLGRAGLPRAEAERQARIEFGGVERFKEEVRETRWENHLQNLFRDFRYAIRSLHKEYRFTITTIFAVALGVGSTTVIFSVVYNGLLHPFPYNGESQLTIFSIHDLGGNDVQEFGRGDRGFTSAEVLDLQEQSRAFEDIMALRNEEVSFAQGRTTLKITAALVTPNAFQFLGVRPLLGRNVTPEDAKPNAPPVFAMNYGLWQEQFNGDPKTLGKSFVIGGVPRTLVAIMPRRFQIGPESSEGFDIPDVWIPTTPSPSESNMSRNAAEPSHFWWLLGRRKRGVSLEEASADLDIIGQRLAKTFPGTYPPKFTMATQPLVGVTVGNFKSLLYALAGAVAMLLLITCANVANLLLARGTTREKEIAIRASIGASRGRLLAQLLVESLVLGLVGGSAGCLLASWGLAGFLKVLPAGSLPEEAAITLNSAALMFALGTTLFTVLVCGLASTYGSLRGELYAHLVGNGGGARESLQGGKLRAALVVAEVALSIVLLTGAGLMVRSLFAITHVDLGFNPSNVLVAELSFSDDAHRTVSQKKIFFDQVLERVAASPGVFAATTAASLPPYSGPWSDVVVAGYPRTDSSRVLFDLCSDGFFKTIGLHLLRGRLLSERDIDSAQRVAVVNETAARILFGGVDAIGRRIGFKVFDMIPGAPHNAYFEIVGVVDDISNQGLRNSPMAEAYLPYTMFVTADGNLLIRTTADPLLMAKQVRNLVRSVDPTVSLTDISSLKSYLHRYDYATPEFGASLSGALAGIALILVVIGVFSVMAYTVSLQTQEIGVRMALGAQQGDVLRMILKKGFVLLAAGICIGVFASYGVTRFLASQIWGVSATDPWTFGAVVALVIGAGLAACYLPARRATEVDPLVALRYE